MRKAHQCVMTRIEWRAEEQLSWWKKERLYEVP
jgi:hypothetical protein